MPKGDAQITVEWLEGLVEYLEETHREWGVGHDERVGDRLKWLSGTRPSYEPDKVSPKALLDQILSAETIAEGADMSGNRVDETRKMVQREQAIRADERRQVAVMLDAMGFDGINKWIESTVPERNSEGGKP